MIIAKRLKGKAIATWLGPTGDAARRAVAQLRQKVTKQPQRLDLYVDIADPWSYLAAQAASRLIKAYPVELAVHVVTPPASDVDPQPTLRTKHAVRDCQQLAEYWNIDFVSKKESDSGSIRDAKTVLIKQRSATDQLQCVIDLGGAIWTNDKKQLVQLCGTWGTESHGEVPPILNSNYAELRKAGHYQSGMFQYGGGWYWGIDRLPYLEAALAADFGTAVANVVTPRPEAERAAAKLSDKPLLCDLWFSYRSPYSYLALEQIEDVLAPYDVPIHLRPMFPMVTRGLEVPAIKRMYIVRDAKREADRLNIPFGELCDPIGAGVDNCIAIAHWAHQRGALMEFSRSAMRGIWAEARDMAEYVDLRYVVERAGLPWNEAREALGNMEATRWANANAADLAVVGLWGVPSFRVGDFVAWGQDRLPLLADRLRRHAAAVSS
ncbi:MAG: oxidoreductase [Myxococcales bacterium]|nr:oxidoreductase [Myxococcales bacterium]